MARGIVSFLAAIGSLVALLAGPASASAAAAGEAQNRVGAFELDHQVDAGDRDGESPAKRRGSAASSGEIASAYLVAPKVGRGLPWAGHRPYAPNRELPRSPSGRPKPESPYSHTQLGTRRGRYSQSREFDENGRPVRDIDWTDHGSPDWHTDPHQHIYGPDGSRGGPGSVWP